MAKRITYVRMYNGGTDEKDFLGDDDTQKLLADYGWFPKDRKLPPQFNQPKTDFTVEELQAMIDAKLGKKQPVNQQEIVADAVKQDTTYPQFTIPEQNEPVKEKKTRRTKAQIAADKKHKA